MKTYKWLIIGSDKRLEITSELLKQAGHHCRYIARDTFDEEIGELLTNWQPDSIVAPILQMKTPIPPQLIAKETVLFTGQTSAEWRQQLDANGIIYRSYLSDERFVWQNAGLTAEAFIQLFYEQTKRQIAGKHFYVAGFGRVGKAVAKALSNMNAAVTVAARSEAQLAEAQLAGYHPLRLDDRTVFTDGYLVNTIPVSWLDAEKAGTARIFDLSSAPGCLKLPHSSEYYTIHLKLPGKYFPEDAAAVLYEALLRMNEERGARCLKENESD